MSLPYLVNHVYNYGTDEVIRRAKKIIASSYAELIEYDALMGTVLFRVRDDLYNTYYKVNISNFKDSKNISLRCGCPYNLSEICRHEAAALLQLQELLDRNMLGEKELVYDQRHTVIKMKQLELKLMRVLASPASCARAENFLEDGKAKIVEAKDERVLAELQYEGKDLKIVIQKNEERNFDTSCNCNEDKEHPLCVHKTIVLLQLLHKYGVNYFDSIRNWDKEKNKLLSLYGYSLSDDIKGKFEFTYKDGKPFLRVLDTNIKRVTTIVPPPRPNVQEIQKIETEVITAEEELQKEKSGIKLGIVFSNNPHQYPYIQVDAVQGEVADSHTAFASKTERLDLGKFINTDVFTEEDRTLIQQLRKLMPGEVSRYLNRNSPFSGIWENIVQQHDDELPEETRYLIAGYLHPKYKKIFSDLSSGGLTFFLPKGKTFITSNLEKVSCSSQFITLQFSASYTNGIYEISCSANTFSGPYSLADNELSSSFIFKAGENLYLWQKPEDVILAEKFLPSGTIHIPAEEWSKQLTQFVLPITKEYPFQFTNIDREELKDVKPVCKLFLKEKGDYLLLQPVFNYNGYDTKPNDKEKIILPIDGKLLIINRNNEVEKEFISKIENLHSNFIHTDGNNTLALKVTDVLKNNWFFLFVDTMQEMNISLYGFDALKNFRFNTAKPKTQIYISSHTDWFDARVDIYFGNQKVTVADIKKALINKQQYVQLQDGSLGILPDEWIRKYSLLFRVGEGKATNIKLSKYHVSVIEELYSQRDEEELFFKLEEKFDKLRQQQQIEEVEPPLHLQKILRPYQRSGFQWLNYLSSVQWGGILADDMGLGKTVQALSFLHHYRQIHGRIKALVACPTTLMYNWENEIKKFTPTLTYYIHHGGNRSKQTLLDPAVDVVITTYGTLRSDIREFLQVQFDYVILDESQAIKNPSSKVTRAACLLNAKNRLCMSGTPLQNNTFDIFAQMNFLNPGLLGSQEFFKNEFAVPIDKFGEKEQKEHLRKLLYPFILRRTKEQVAKDLPAKSEMVLFCEMGEEQRNIYDAFRNDFRDKILGTVQEQGIQRSQLTILQGLMKLRQICDSPAIMKDDEKYPNVSVKLDEIGREITENIGDHKALVFSQFLGMLALIKEKLKELGVDYEYFDGSTSAQDREKAIQRFQNDDNCRVFLISLKAGGVGINLTAADYVYIVDPWWNPAVEQQAIDRTHRIGQTKNIFAYRMICKDTVEDKILQLQEKKRLLAADLITDDSGFVKSLTKEDIEYLFS